MMITCAHVQCRYRAPVRCSPVATVVAAPWWNGFWMARMIVWTHLMKVCRAAHIHHVRRKWNEKVSCRRQAARCFMSLNISLSHWRSFNVIGNSTDRYTSSYWHSAVTMDLHWIISETKHSIGGKSRFFQTPLHSTPPLGGTLSVYYIAIMLFIYLLFSISSKKSYKWIGAFKRGEESLFGPTCGWNCNT